MSETTAVPTDWLVRAHMGQDNVQPMCPGCPTGRLHPYRVTIPLTVGVDRWNGVDYLEGWVAVCQGAKAGEHFVETDQPPCGFALPMTPHRRGPA